MLQLGLLAAAERGINHVLALDSTALPRLAALSGKVLAIEATQPAFCFYILPDAQGLRLASQWHGDVHCRAQAPLTNLLQLALSQNKTQVLHGPDFELLGDSAVLLELAGILQDLELDWEFALMRWCGPLATPLLAAPLRHLGRWGSDSAASLRLTLAEYVSEESRSLVGQREAQSRFNELDALKLSLERLEARVARLSSPSSSSENA